MNNLFISLINQLNSSVFVLLLLLLTMFFGVYKLGSWQRLFSHHEEKLNDLKQLSKDVTELKIKVDLIYQNTHPRRLVDSHSPINLTPLGAQLAEQIHAQQLLDKYAEKLIENVETTHPKSAYDIQTQSMHVAKQQLIYLLNEQDLNLIKQKAFQNGLLLEDFFSIFGVLLRDKILALKGIQVSQVDQPEFR